MEVEFGHHANITQGQKISDDKKIFSKDDYSVYKDFLFLQTLN